MHPALTPHTDLLVTAADPKAPRMLEHPRPVRVRWHTYGGQNVELVLDQVAAAPGLVCVAQTRPEPFAWNAWVPIEAVRPA